MSPRLFRGSVSGRNFETSLSPRYINMLKIKSTKKGIGSNPF